jgi:hypothetical protein
VLLDEQDRSRWDHRMIAEGEALVDQALREGRPGPYQLHAAIAACHSGAPSAGETDWRQIVGLYGELRRLVDPRGSQRGVSPARFAAGRRPRRRRSFGCAFLLRPRQRRICLGDTST